MPRKRKPRPGKRRVRPVRFLGKLILYTLLFTVLWVGIYRFVPVPATSIQIRDWTNGTGVTKDWVALDDIAPALPRAVIGAE
ncbi:MAG: monofunctional biosynthetic peptidoglycan transglycosylase, partial [Pacificimonas sp.]